MATMHTIEVWVVVDEDGDYAVATDKDTANERYAEEVSADGSQAKRVVCVTLQVPAPQVVQVKATLPEDKVEVVASVE